MNHCCTAFTLVAFALLTLAQSGCQSAYYAAAEKFGYAKRDILVSRVQTARDEQNATKEQFKTTLERFAEVVKVEGGDLEAKYKKLSNEYQKSQTRASAVTDKINSVESVAGAMFSEWKSELGQYSNPDLRRGSEQQLEDTRARYEQMIAAMKRAEQRMTPVLAAFKDQVLFLKHNLNSRAIASISGTAAGIETDVSALIREMEASINEANAFIGDLKKS